MTGTPTPATLRALAERLAREAGAIALAGRRADVVVDSAFDEHASTTTKSSRTDLVTRFDRAAEDHIVGVLGRERPDDAILGEEGTDQTGSSGLAWLIDPIDGTTNYVYDQPAWSCSVAVARDDVMVAGAVFVPVLDELFSAALGDGATLDGRPIGPTDETDPTLALVGTGFAYDAATRRHQAEVVTDLIDHVRDIRRLGSAAVDLCLVACGRLDAYYERHLNSWDAAAGELIAREAGAITSDFAGGPARPAELLAAAPGLHAAMVDLLRPTGRAPVQPH